MVIGFEDLVPEQKQPDVSFADLVPPAAPLLVKTSPSDWATRLNFSALEQQHGLPAGSLQAVLTQESQGDPNALSPKGAKGLFQFMPDTAAQYKIDPSVPEQAASGAAQYLSALYKQNNNDFPRALAGYNWGPGNLKRQGFENMPPETRNYISKVSGYMPTASSGQIMSDANAPGVSFDDLIPQAPAAAAGAAPVSFEDLVPTNAAPAAQPLPEPPLAPYNPDQWWATGQKMAPAPEKFGPAAPKPLNLADAYKAGVMHTTSGIEDIINTVKTDGGQTMIDPLMAAVRRAEGDAAAARTTQPADVRDLASLGKYIAETGVGSIPQMVMAGSGLPGMGLLAASEAAASARNRAQNQGQETATLTPAQVAPQIPAGMIQAGLEKFGLGKILEAPVAKGAINLVKSTLKAAGWESGEEALQQAAQYISETLGTLKGFSGSEMAQQMGWAAIAAGPTGAAIHVGAHGLTSATQKIQDMAAEGRLKKADAEKLQGFVSQAAQSARQNWDQQQGQAATSYTPNVPAFVQGQEAAANNPAIPPSAPVSPALPQVAAPVSEPIPAAPVAPAKAVEPPVATAGFIQPGQNVLSTAQPTTTEAPKISEGAIPGTPTVTSAPVAPVVNPTDGATEAKGLPMGSVNPGDVVHWQGSPYTVESISSDGIAARLKTNNPRMSLDIPLTELSRPPVITAPVSEPAGSSNYSMYDEARKKAQQSAKPGASESTLFGATQGAARAKPGFTPVINYLAERGGFNQKSQVAQQLSGIGITPDTHTRLFRKSSNLGLDNIPVSEFNNNFAGSGIVAQDDGTGHVDQSWLLDQIRQEAHGQGISSPEQQARIDKQKQIGEILNILGKEGHDITSMTNEEVQVALDKYMAETEKQHTQLPHDGEDIPFAEQASTKKSRSAYSQSEMPGASAAASGRTFENFSNKENIGDNHKVVYKALGMDPEKTSRLPPKQQLNILTQAAHTILGITVNVDEKADVRYAMDQVADSVVGLSTIADMLGLNQKFMGLDGMTLNVMKNYRYLGSFLPGENIITLPQRSNSLAHEWFHALDYYLVKKFGGTEAMFSEEVHGANQAKKGQGINITASQQSDLALKLSMVQMLNKVFFDQAQVASKIIELQGTIEKSKNKKLVDAAQAELKDILGGRYKGTQIKSEFYHRVKSFNDAPYWTSPAEMLARSAESYIAERFHQMGIDQSRVSKDQAAYISEADDRLSKSFPQAQDRMAIYMAMDDFFVALSNHSFVGDSVDEFDMGPLDPAHIEHALPGIPKGILQQLKHALMVEKRNILSDIKTRKEMDRRQAELAQFDLLGPSTKEKTIRMLYEAGRPLASSAFRLRRVYPNSTSIPLINGRIFAEPGVSNATTTSPFMERQAMLNTAWHAKLTNIFTKHGWDDAADGDMGQLYLLMTGRDFSADYKGSKQDRARITATEQAIRKDIFDNSFDAMVRAGLPLSYNKDSAYLTRIPLVSKIAMNRDAATEDFVKAYEKMFDERYGTAELLDKNILDLMEELNNLKRGTEFNDTKKSFQKLINSILKNQEFAAEIIQENYDFIKNEFALQSAKNYIDNILSVNLDFSGTGKANPSFMKGRILSPAAHAHMDPWMEQNVFHIAKDYTSRAARSIAAKEAENPIGKPKLDDLFKNLVKEGVHPDDIKYLKALIDHAMGRNAAPVIGYSNGSIADSLQRLSLQTNLGRSVFASLPEIFSTPTITGNLLDNVRVLSGVLQNMAGTNKMAEMRDIVEMLGLIENGFNDLDFEAQYGMDNTASLEHKEHIRKFMRQNQVIPLTNQQRVILMPAIQAYMKRLANKATGGSWTQIGEDQAIRDLSEHSGLAENDVPAFAVWLKDNIFTTFPKPSDPIWQTPHGQALARSIHRIQTAIVVNPNKAEKPYLSTKSKMSSLFYMAQGFNYAQDARQQTRNIMRAVTALEKGGKAAAILPTMRLLMPLFALLPPTLAITVLRIFLTEHDKWETMSDDEKAKYALFRALQNINIFSGAGSTVMGMITGLSYGKDFATTLLGAAYGMPIDFLTKLSMWSGVGKLLGANQTNSGKTNTAENNLARSAYHNVVAPLIIEKLVKYLPSRGIGGMIAGLMIGFAGSGTASGLVADAVAGPKAPAGGAKAVKTNVFGDVLPKKTDKTNVFGQTMPKKSERTNVFGQPIGK